MKQTLQFFCKLHKLSVFRAFWLAGFVFFCIPVAFVETTRVPSGVVVTPQSFLRTAEGDLHLYVGEEKQPISPYVHQIASAGIHFSTIENGIQYQFHVQSANVVLPQATQEISAGVVSVTASNITQEKRNGVFWCAWQHASIPHTYGTHGILLEKTDPSDLVSVPHDLEWNPKWTWFFEEYGFVRQNKVVYWPAEREGWELRSWVRPNTLPYRPLSQQSQLGISQYLHELPSGQTAALRILLPYLPVDLEVYRRYVSVIPPGESTPVDPPEPQRKTQ